MLKAIKLLITTLLILFLLFISLIFSGIKIDSFSLGNFSISKLYIKYDKKLILELDELVFDYVSSDEKITTKELKERFLQIPKVLDYFEKIDIERLKLKNNEFTILIDKEEFYLNNKDINISANLKFIDKQLHMDIYSIYFKDLNLTLYGESKVDAQKEIINFFGYYNKDNMDGELNLNLNKEILDFYVNTSKGIKSLKFLKDLFRLDKVAEAWMYDNVEGDINLNYLYGQIDLKKQKVILDSIKGQAIIKDAKIRFHKDAKTVDTSRLKVDYENDTLSFDLKEPVYGNSKLYGSRVYIPNLTSMEKGLVVVDLKTNSMLNEDILEILRAYKIKLPLKQLSGESDSSLVLKIPYMASKKMDIDGRFILEDANLKLNNFEFYTKNADVVLKDRMVYVKESLVKHKDLIEGVLNLDIDTSTLKANGRLDVSDFRIKADKQDIINLNKNTIPFNIDFKEETKIELSSLDSNILIKDDIFSLKVNSLQTVYPYSNLLQDLSMKEGVLKVDIAKNNAITFEALVKKLDLPLEKNGKKITELDAKGVVTDTQTEITTKDSDIKIVIEKNSLPQLSLKGIDVVYNKESSSLKSKIPTIKVHLEDSTIKLDKDTSYEVSKADIVLKEDEIIFEAEPKNLDLPFLKDSKKVESIVLEGVYKDDLVRLNSKDKKINVRYEKLTNKIFVNIEDYDLIYNTQNESKIENKLSYIINGKNSNIVINDKYIAKANSYDFIFTRYNKDLKLNYKDTTFVFKEDFEGNITLNAKNMSDEFLNSLINKDLVNGGFVNIDAAGKNNIINGTAYIKNSKIKDLAILNNLLILINTSPGLINPLLAIPSVVGMATTGGFNINGYRIIDGKVEFIYDSSSKNLNMYSIFTKGNGIDFEGNAKFDFENSTVDSKLKLIFFKNYSKIVGEIPVFNYLFLGDEKRVDTEVEIYGSLDDPKYKTNLAKDGVSAPVNFFKRLFNAPKKIYDSISE